MLACVEPMTARQHRRRPIRQAKSNVFFQQIQNERVSTEMPMIDGHLRQ
jgi:hypothetical protein